MNRMRPLIALAITSSLSVAALTSPIDGGSSCRGDRTGGRLYAGFSGIAPVPHRNGVAGRRSRSAWTLSPSSTVLAPAPSTTSLEATRQDTYGGGGGKRTKNYQTIGEVMKEMEADPAKFLSRGADGGKKKSRRSRKRVDRPKQQYMYASQRERMEAEPRVTVPVADGDDEDGEAVVVEEVDPEEAARKRRAANEFRAQKERKSPLGVARALGLANPAATQRAEVVVGSGPEEVPRIVATVRVDDEGDEVITSSSFAYVVYKPAGWSIIGGEKKKKKKKEVEKDADDSTGADADADADSSSEAPKSQGSSGSLRRVKAYDESVDEFYIVEYDESAILDVLTPEERAELLNEGGLNLSDELAETARASMANAEYDDGIEDEVEDEDGNVDGSGGDKEEAKVQKKKEKTKKKAAPGKDTVGDNFPPIERTQSNIESSSRPSLVAWLKNLKAEEGTPIKGGKNLPAIAGAVDVDDSGLVLLCPRDKIGSVHVDRAEYVAIVGNARKTAPRSKLQKTVSKSAGGGGCETADDSAAKVEILSKLRRGRDTDPILTVSASFPGGASTCSRAALLCQDKFNDGVRGDPAADPLDRRAARRLVHCTSLAVTSLARLDDEPVVVQAGPQLPGDVAIYADRRAGAVFERGSYLGRREGLRENGLTTAYREINGAADGHPGWIVDRYDKWLFVQHSEEIMPERGMRPSLHDGHTTGVYSLGTKVDRSVMGKTADAAKPILLEGQPAPEVLPILENGITYHVDFESFSTGIFLDQRFQRAWLAESCTEETRVLNCFAHTGAFSVAAATAGASTVSLDLDRKWLSRVRPQMEANGIHEWEGKHDCIYGDCFDWLARLRKRGEQYDIVILDPPSTSVGKKKKRWSVKNDMAELVALAAPLVKKDGLLWTTTNSASIRPQKFASMCKKGLEDAGLVDAKLERVSPMPHDFPSIGPQPVKNLIWRIP